ncbi:MAG: glucosaminidase domain-containing protein [Caenispirillum sp.]|nr:glucosaminidase domain-containing protein [Caenispirillum sp.]
MRTTTPTSGRWFDRFALGFLGTCVLTLYGATVFELATPYLPGAPARGEVGTALSGSVPALRYTFTSDGQEARTLQPAAMTKVSFPAPEPLPVRLPGDGFAERPRLASAETVREVARLYDALGYDLERVATGVSVPRLYLATVPDDMPAVDDIETRKSVFIRSMLPLILRVNEEVARDRARLIEIDARLKSGEGVHRTDMAWVAELADSYGVRDADIPKLLRKVDVVPPSLALAQAIEESGWGTSRFAREANALFGQWTTKSHVPGIKTYVSPSDPNYNNRIRAFPSLLDAVRSYVRNLNTHRAYAEFREERARQRRAGTELNGHALAGHLHFYSERGPDYIATLREIMRANALADLDGTRLGRQLAALP